MVATAAILDFVSVDQRTNAWVDWSNFSVAHWGWLEEVSFRWSALPLIQDGCYGRHLGFGLLSIRQLEDKRLGRLIRFFCDLLGWLGEDSFRWAAHPRCPLRQSSWIWFPSIRRQTPGSIHPIFLWLIGVTRRRFLSMITSATHPRWPLCPTS
jgi:hypothetical protein